MAREKTPIRNIAQRSKKPISWKLKNWKAVGSAMLWRTICLSKPRSGKATIRSILITSLPTTRTISVAISTTATIIVSRAILPQGNPLPLTKAKSCSQTRNNPTMLKLCLLKSERSRKTSAKRSTSTTPGSSWKSFVTSSRDIMLRELSESWRSSAPRGILTYLPWFRWI